METPVIRPGLVRGESAPSRVVAFFPNASQGNLAIQLLMILGVPADGLGVTSPEKIEGGQGMLLSIPCPEQPMRERVEALCRDLGARLHRQRP